MSIISLVLGLFACASYGRRVRPSAEELRSSQLAECQQSLQALGVKGKLGSLQALATLFLRVEPRAAFNPSCLAARFCVGSPTFSSRLCLAVPRQKGPGHREALIRMSDEFDDQLTVDLAENVGEDSKDEDPKQDSEEHSREDLAEHLEEDSPEEVSEEDLEEDPPEASKDESMESFKEDLEKGLKEILEEDPKAILEEDPKEIREEDPKEEDSTEGVEADASPVIHSKLKVPLLAEDAGHVLEATEFEGGSRLTVNLGADSGMPSPLVFETGKIGRQANGAVMLTVGDTILLATVCAEKDAQDIDFAPLRVDYQERMSSAGKTKGGYIKRDGRPSANEILVARIIDRPLRPMMLKGWTHETQLLVWLLSYDGKINPEPLALCAASAALAISDIPMKSTVAAVSVEANSTGHLKVNPSRADEEAQTASLQMTLAGTEDFVLMIEGAANFLPEDDMLQAVEYAQSKVRVLATAVDEWAKAYGKPKRTDTIRKPPELLKELMEKEFGVQAHDALAHEKKAPQSDAISALDEAVMSFFVEDLEQEARAGPILSDGAGERKAEKRIEELPSEKKMFEDPDQAPIELANVDEEIEEIEDDEDLLSKGTAAASVVATVSKSDDVRRSDVLFAKPDVQAALKEMLCKKLRAIVVDTGKRTDGRLPSTVRPLNMETGFLPGVHGSALFTRGDTQSIATVTIGGSDSEQRVENVDGKDAARFYLQYTFPPCSVGEVGRFGAPGRREIGHGNLAERALAPGIPDEDKWPYTTRVESLITESHGSSSMASVCGGSLAMLHAGVPLIHGNIAGIAMGMLLPEPGEEGEPIIISDILGVEDALGTMDFKTAGTREGVSTFQLDIKCEGLTLEVMKKALEQAREGRLHIIEAMDAIQAEPSLELHPNVPKVKILKISTGAIGRVIGPGGETVRGLIAEFVLDNIHIEETLDGGVVQIISTNSTRNQKAAVAILQLLGEDGTGVGQRDRSIPGENTTIPETGKILRGLKVVKVLHFGLFVEVDAEQELDGLILMKDIDTAFIKDIFEEWKEGDTLDAKVLGISQHSGKLLLSRRVLMDRGREVKDLTVPGPDVEIPESGSTFRDLKVMSVTKNGVTVEVDAKQSLHGFIYIKDLDTGFIPDIFSWYKVGDILDANVVGLVNGRLLLSRRALLDQEGVPGEVSKPGSDVTIPEPGTIYRDMKILKVLSFGIFVEVDPEQALSGLILMRDLDTKYVREINYKEGDKVDAKVVGLSQQSGKLLLSRKALLEDEGEGGAPDGDGKPKQLVGQSRPKTTSKGGRGRR